MESEVVIIRRNLLIFSLILITCLILFSIIFAIRTSDKIVKSISTLSSGLNNLVDGDFTKKIVINSKDEISALGNEVNLFQDEMNTALNIIQESSTNNEKANSDLLTNTSNSSAVATEISANIDSIYVITSYSIHYTKLYEPCASRCCRDGKKLGCASNRFTV